MTLLGKRIVITRAPHQAAELAEMLRERGAEPLLYPCIDIQPPDDTTALDNSILQASNGMFDWLVLTSANTVEALRQRCTVLGLSLAKLQTVAVGPATALAAQQLLGVKVEIVPDEHVAEALADTLNFTPETHIFLPQADIARDTLSDLLVHAGTQVTSITSYHTVIGQGGVNLAALLAAGQVDAMTFTSSSTVINCLQRLRTESADIQRLTDVVCACIGPKTAQTAAEAGFAQVMMPETYTLPGLVGSLETHWKIQGDEL